MHVPEKPSATTVPIRPPGKAGLWKKMGGGPLMIAILLHLILLVIAAFWISRIIHPPDKTVDFMPAGSGGGEQSSNVRIQQKRQAQVELAMNPNRIVALDTVSGLVLPEIGQDFGQMKPLASASGGGISGGLGEGSGGKGIGNGFGAGHVAGGGMGSGMSGGLKLFGMNLKVDSFGVVLDVSRSMTPYLKRVVDEVNRVAEDSPVIMQFGCGISTHKSANRQNTIEPVTAPDDGFKKFWYWYQADKYRGAHPSERKNVDPAGPVPSPRVFAVFEKRPYTYYHEKANTTTTADAILGKPLRDVAAIYWFADFEDEIQPEAAQELLKTLKSRNQKLYIQASKPGKFLHVARDMIAIPSGGGEIKPINF